jgi:hypothetical protein
MSIATHAACSGKQPQHSNFWRLAWSLGLIHKSKMVGKPTHLGGWRQTARQASKTAEPKAEAAADGRLGSFIGPATPIPSAILLLDWLVDRNARQPAPNLCNAIFESASAPTPPEFFQKA